jgi:hypothetical protein
VVEEVDVGESTRLEQAEDALGLGCKVRDATEAAFTLTLTGSEEIGEEHRAQGEAADAAGGLPEEGATGQVVEAFLNGVHGLVAGDGFAEVKEKGRYLHPRRVFAGRDLGVTRRFAYREDGGGAGRIASIAGTFAC